MRRIYGRPASYWPQPVRSIESDLERGLKVHAADMAAMAANDETRLAEAVAVHHGERQAVLRLADAQPPMRARKDGRTKAKRVKKRDWKASRKNKLIPSIKGMKRKRKQATPAAH